MRLILNTIWLTSLIATYYSLASKHIQVILANGLLLVHLEIDFFTY